MSKTSPTLLTIAGELRNRIYELVLLEDDKVYPFDYKPCSCNCPKYNRQAPCISLLRVNKQINAEATEILYSSVTFHLTTGYALMRFMAVGELCMYGTPNSKHVFSSRHLIRSLHLKVVPEYIPNEVHSSRMLECWADPIFQTITKKQRAQIIHQNYREVCQMVWTNAGKVVTEMKGLNLLSIDVEQAFCPSGCCRMVGHVLKSFQGLKKKDGFKITISGELKHEEQEMLLRGLGISNDFYKKKTSLTDQQIDSSSTAKDDDQSSNDEVSEENGYEDENVAEDENFSSEEDEEDEEDEDEEEEGEEEEDEDRNSYNYGDAVNALRALHASILNGQPRNVENSPSTVNLSVSTIEYAPQT